jgi:hypothetical protein
MPATKGAIAATKNVADFFITRHLSLFARDAQLLPARSKETMGRLGLMLVFDC